MRVDATIALSILRLPRIAAMADGSPFSRLSVIFSRITIDESTIIPIPRIRPDIVIILIVKFIIAITISVIRMEMGIDKPIISALLIPRKKKKMTNIASTAPSIPEEYTWFIVEFIRVASSLKILTEIPLGSRSLISGSISWIPRDIADALEPDSLDTLIYSAGTPFIYTSRPLSS